MAWIALELKLTGSDVELFSDALFESGAVSVDVTDASPPNDHSDDIYLEPGGDYFLSWNNNLVVGLFDSRLDPGKIIEEVSLAVGRLSLPEYTMRRIDDMDWVRETQKQFKPIRVTDRLRVAPSWSSLEGHSDIDIILDPGIAFGTGSHPTTKLCLRWLEQNVARDQVIIDYGCGSGILGIAAKKYGSERVYGLDIDDDALKTAQSNSFVNGVEIEFVTAGEAFRVRADVIVANILSAPLKMLAPLFSQLVVDGGRVVLSGVLSEQEQEIVTVYSDWFDMDVYDSLEGWICLQGVRKSN